MTGPAAPHSFISYERRTFGWLENPGSVELVLPPLGRSVALIEEAGALLISSFLVVAGVAIIWMLLHIADSVLMVFAVGLLLLGASLFSWIWTIRRLVAVASLVSTCAAIRISADELTVSDPAAPRRIAFRCPRSEVAGLRLDILRQSRYLASRVRLQIVTRNDDCRAIRLPWPADVSVRRYEDRLRAAVDLPPRKVRWG